ncbi:MAG: hypothetical protein A3F12_07985 [Gammaproteobacteria bacterium RIFCSPHIGHO2_12_FULL_38_14]|nr:MAG: hypothetical protein A3F12_07985 [Gammaproteobacteria bacterium RIFCSPHIGHO2_12_FULL_38_14]
MNKFLATLLVCCIMFLNFDANAEENSPIWSITLGDGHAFFAKRRSLENANLPFVAAGYFFNQRYEIEALAGSFNTKFKNPTSTERQINGLLFALDGVYHASLSTVIKPFFMAGLGVFAFSEARTDSNDQGNINAGIGSNFFISPSIAFRLELRDFYTIVGGYNDILLDGGLSVFF